MNADIAEVWENRGRRAGLSVWQKL